MTARQEPATALRIGDRERQAAVATLGEHWGAGRLDSDEFDDRTAIVLKAKTSAELAWVFHDLPVGLLALDESQVKKSGIGARLIVVGALALTGTGALTAFMAIAEPYRLQLLLSHVHELLYQLGG